MQREKSSRRDDRPVSEARIPWYWDAHSRRAAVELIQAQEDGIVNVLLLRRDTAATEYAVRAHGTTSSVATIEAENRQKAKAGQVHPFTTHIRQYGSFENAREGVSRVEAALREYNKHTRSVHLVHSCASSGAVTGVDGWQCDCKAWWDTGQCKPMLPRYRGTVVPAIP